MKIKLSDVNKSYNGLDLAVKNINVEVGKGEFLVLLGPSGCGKSTLLRMIAGLEEISSGNLLIDGKIANELSPYKRKIGMVFQNYALYPHLNVKENLKFPLKVGDFDKAQINKMVDSIASIVGLKDLLERKPTQLSGGQRQRVALGRALIKKPEIFLFDEPLSNLDAKLRSSIRGEILRIHKLSGASSVYVTHDQNEAMTMADKIVLLNKGEVRQIGPPKKLYEEPADTFVAKFMGYPEINLFDKQTFLENGSFVKEDKEYFENIEFQKIGVRSENIELKEDKNGNSPSFVEYLGINKILFFEENNIKVSTNLDASESAKYILKLNQKKVVLFDKNEKLIC